MSHPQDSWAYAMASRRPRTGARRWSTVAALTALLLTFSTMAIAAVTTDQQEYEPGSVVTISGDNSDGAGYLAGETVTVDVVGPNGYFASCAGVADDAGSWSCQVTLWLSLEAVGDYTYTATGSESGVVESGMFSDGTVIAAPITVKESTCTTAQTTFTLGDTVCAETTVTIQGSGTSSFRFEWIDPNGNVDKVTEIGANPLPTGPHTDTFTPDETGTWTVKTCAPKDAPCNAGTTLDTETFLVEDDGNGGVSTGQINCHYHTNLTDGGASYTNLTLNNEATVAKKPATHGFTIHCSVSATGKITNIKVQGGMTVSKLSSQPSYAYLSDSCANSGTAHLINISKNSNVSTSNLSELEDATCHVKVTIDGAQWSAGSKQLSGGWSAVFWDSNGDKQRSDAPETPLTVNVV